MYSILPPTRVRSPLTTSAIRVGIWQQNTKQTEPVVDTVGHKLLTPDLEALRFRHPILARRCLSDTPGRIPVPRGFLLGLARFPAIRASGKWIMVSKNVKLDSGEGICAAFRVLGVLGMQQNGLPRGSYFW